MRAPHPSSVTYVTGRRNRFSIDGSRTWAVLIGIDSYNDPMSLLRGCVRDALDMRTYLMEDLIVPEDRIQLLLSPHPYRDTVSDTTAFQVLVNPIGHIFRNLYPELLATSSCSLPTRENIIRTLVNLSTNSKIQRSDHIIVFFSGHGSSYACSSYFKDDIGRSGNVEVLCPMDRTSRNVPHRSIIPDISDREINVILKRICHAKGHQITVILDCCHSGGATRLPDTGIRLALPVEGSLRHVLEAAEKQRKNGADHVSVLSGDWKPDTFSHVVLAACKEYQLAKEVTGDDGKSAGVFTGALLRTLRYGPLTSNSTYVELHRALPSSSSQTPVVAGQHKTERIWFQK
ncbi:peptidase C14, caspase domain-containing protein [Armillaria borealis]|uniref:Peptidase C14, caspase domain-containing protein n=1 Tax=Armillaria borealis TaxID=47425 RepID=A0AA39JKA6_9AGAR|nr:peptidase C14, caspase domain-containing protein [Armillaria borealis]